MTATRPVRDARGEPLDWETLLRSCIHCGLCLNACPTYRITGDEAESPRGRLMLLHEVLAPGATPLDFERGSLDRCLGCLGCQTVCPSGVPYGHLLEHGRAVLGPAPGSRPQWVRWLVDEVLGHPRRLFFAARGGALLRRTGLDRLLPQPLRGMLAGLPRRAARWPRRPSAAQHGDVAILSGCGQWAFTPDVLEATVQLVRAAGSTPFIPAAQRCCGALSQHQGTVEVARELARHAVDTFEGAAALIVPSAGCSAHLKHLDEVLADDPAYAARAAALAGRTVDLLEWLDQHREFLAFRPDTRRVAYHPPCHHLHAQGIDGLAERLLGRVRGLELVRHARRDLCCGSAGSWSLLFPELAQQRRTEKLDDLLAPGPDLVLTANPGCELFLDAGLAERDRPPRIEHLACYLARQLETPAVGLD